MQRPDSSHAAGNAQSPIALHVCAHFPPLQAYGAQLVSAPLSRSVAMSVQTAPEMHAPVGRSQPKPSAQSESTTQLAEHVRVVPSQRFGEHEGTPREPRARGVHVPRFSEHVSQAPSHAVSQQNDPTQ